MHYTACSKAEPVYLDVEYLSMQPACNFAFEHQLEAMPVSNRSSCAIIVFLLHSSPRRVIKVRSSFLPRGLTRVGDKKVRIVSEAVVCWSRFMLPPATELLTRTLRQRKSYQCYDLIASFPTLSLILLSSLVYLMFKSQSSMCNTVVLNFYVTGTKSAIVSQKKIL